MEILKRSLCLLVILCTLATAGCTGENVSDPSSEPVSDGTNSENPNSSENSDSVESSDGSEVSVPEDDGKTEESDSAAYIAKIDNLLSGTSDRTLNSKNVLKGRSYKTTIEANESYPDKGTILTDGVIDTKFGTNSTWAGYLLYSAGQVNSIDFDLGSTQIGLLDFTVTALVLDAYAIFIPDSVDVLVAGEDGVFTKVGTAYSPKDFDSQGSTYNFSIKLQKAVEARYIKFDIHGKKGWCFIGEVSATSYDESNKPDSSTNGDLNAYYGFEGIPVIETAEYWNSDDSDFDTEANLILSKMPMISATETVDPSLLTNWYNSAAAGLLVNKGTAVTPNINDNAWYHITHGGTRSITWDLGKTSAVSAFSVGFLRDLPAGVHFPTDITVRISDNGTDWQTIFLQETITSDNEQDIVRIEADFENTYKARYFQLFFRVHSHTYIDEVRAFGTKNTENATDIVPDPETPEENGKTKFTMPEDFCDVNNMLLSYHCSVDETNTPTEDGLITVEEYLPHVAYLDKDGNIVDTFFDAFLYLPYTNLVHAEGTSDFGRSADGWRTYVDDMFKEDSNINALDECAELVYNELGITDQKLKVFTSILYTFPNLFDGSKNPFGDIDGDGIDEDFSKVEDRKKAIKWIMDEELRRFEEGNYQNLQFCGYYWFEESISYADSQEAELVNFAVEYAHELGYKIFWIPYKTAAGVEEWESMGFDAACLQPNYMFGSAPTGKVLYETAERAKRLGMCVEIEFNDPNNRTEARKYIEYLIAGAETGYMNAVKMYYQVGVPGAFHITCYSENASVRKIYDDTYLFAKEKYVPVLPDDVVISETPLEFTYTYNEKCEGKVDISQYNDLFAELVVTVSPKYGAVQLNVDGSFTYFPAEDFSGEDEFQIALDIGYGEPVPTTIKLKCE